MRITVYALETKNLQNPYRNQESLNNSTPLDSHESSTPFGAFHVGDGVSDGPSLRYLGNIQYIHHWIGDYGDDQILHKTILYLYDDAR